jgi:hypothetical protein
MKSIAICCLTAVLAAPVLAQDASAPLTEAAVTTARPVQWAEPVEMEGVSNLHRISPTLYRSEQPTALGMKNLEKLGIRTVINLRAFNGENAGYVTSWDGGALASLPGGCKVGARIATDSKSAATVPQWKELLSNDANLKAIKASVVEILVGY